MNAFSCEYFIEFEATIFTRGVEIFEKSQRGRAQDFFKKIGVVYRKGVSTAFC